MHGCIHACIFACGVFYAGVRVTMLQPSMMMAQGTLLRLRVCISWLYRNPRLSHASIPCMHLCMDRPCMDARIAFIYAYGVFYARVRETMLQPSMMIAQWNLLRARVCFAWLYRNSQLSQACKLCMNGCMHPCMDLPCMDAWMHPCMCLCRWRLLC